MTNRRGLFQLGAVALGGLASLVLAVPGVAYILDPIIRPRASRGRDLRVLPISLKELEIGVPKQIAIVDSRTDAWVKYPEEPVGAVWLIRQPEGATPQVIALSAECPHLGCAVNLGPDGKGFFCPCHTSSFTLAGQPTNSVPPRPMDSLEISPVESPDAPLQLRFQRFRVGIQEKSPLA
jgi:Rieske Fe-S protein